MVMSGNRKLVVAVLPYDGARRSSFSDRDVQRHSVQQCFRYTVSMNVSRAYSSDGTSTACFPVFLPRAVMSLPLFFAIKQALTCLWRSERTGSN